MSCFLAIPHFIPHSALRFSLSGYRKLNNSEHPSQYRLPYDTCTGLNITRDLRLLHAGHFSTLYKSALAKPCPRWSIILSTSSHLTKRIFP